MKLEIEFDKAAIAKIEQLPIDLQMKTFDGALRAACQPVLKRAKQEAPRGNDEDREKRSAKQKAKADWDFPLWKSIELVIAKKEKGATCIIGPSWPKGNKSHFDYSRKVFGIGRKKVLWGMRTVETVVKTNHFLKRAFDMSQEEMLHTFTQKIEEALLKDG